MADGTSFTIDLPVVGQSAIDAAASSVDKLSARLDAATKASEETSSAVKAGEIAYKQAEQAADRTAKALERIGAAAEVQRTKLAAAMNAGDEKAADRAAVRLRALTDRQAELASRASASRAALANQALALDALRASASRAEDHQRALAREVKAAEQAQREAAKASELAAKGMDYGPLAESLGKLGGPLGFAGQRAAGLAGNVQKLHKILGLAAPFVAVTGLSLALAAGIAAAGIAAAASTVKIFAWAVSLADAARSARLLSAGLVQSTIEGKLLDGQINALTRTLPLSRDELSGMAKTLAESGLRGKELATALETTATEAAKTKFGPDFSDEMLSLSQQSKVLQLNISSLFGGLKIDGLLKGLRTLAALFDENTASGKAIKTVFESIAQPLVDALARATPKIELFFLKLEIMALKALIAIKPYGSTILKVGEVLVIVAGVIMGVFVVALGALVGALVLLAATLALPFAAFAALGAALYGVIQGFGEVLNFLRGISLAEIGAQIIQGLVDGIKSGATAVVDSVKGVATGAIDAAKNALGIQSPSKVFAEIGQYTGEGMEMGVARSAPRVQTSLESLVSPPELNAPTGAQSSGAQGSAAVSLNGVTFNLYGVENADDAVSRIGELMTKILEGDASTLGATTNA